MEVPAPSKTVLLVMRHAEDRLLFGDMLDRDGFETMRIGSFEAARKLAEEQRPRMLLLSLDEDADQAFSFITWIKHHRAPICRVVGLTANPITARHAQDAGCDRCLQLPLPMSQLVMELSGLP